MSIFSRIAALIFGEEPEAPAATSSSTDPDAIRRLLEFEMSQRRIEEDQYHCKTLMENPEDD